MLDQRVNGTNQTQNNSVTLSLPDGSYLVSWQETVEDRDDENFNRSRIYTQRYAENGDPIGDKVPVGDPEFVSLYNQDAAVLSDGSIAISFLNTQNQLCVQKFGPDGELEGDVIEFGAQATPIYFAKDTRIVPLEDGEFLVTWLGGGKLQGMQCNADGEILNDVPIDLSPIDDQDYQSYSYDVIPTSDGGFAVSIPVNHNHVLDKHFDVMVQKFTISDGIATQTANFFVSDSAEDVNEFNPVIAELAGGGYAISWVDPGDNSVPGHSYDVYTRTVDASGNPTSETIKVHADSTLRETDPQIVALPDGGYFVGWVDNDISASSNLIGQRFDATGNKIDAPLSLNIYTSGDSDDFSMTLLEDGRLSVSWQEDRGSSGDRGVYHRVVEIPGMDVTPVAGNFNPVVGSIDPVETAEIGFDQPITYKFKLPDTAFYDLEDSDLTLEVTQADGSPLPDWLTFDAGAQRLYGDPGHNDFGELTLKITATDSQGASVDYDFDLMVNEAYQGDDEIKIDFDDSITSSQVHPANTTLPDGTVVTVWYETNPVENKGHVHSRIVAADGTVLQDKQMVSTDPSTHYSAMNPDVITTADGGYLVYWSAGVGINATDGIHAIAQKFHADGTPDGDVLDLGRANYPEIIELESGDFLLVANGMNGTSGMQGQIFHPDGSTSEDAFYLEDTHTSGAGFSFHALPDGGFIGSWHMTGGEVIAVQRYNSRGVPDSSENIVVHDGLKAANGFKTTSLDVFSDGSFVVAYTATGQDGTSHAWYRRFDSFGDPIDDEPVPLHDRYTLNQTEANVVALADDSFFVVWREQEDTSSRYDIMAQRFTADGEPTSNPFVVNDDVSRTSYQITPDVSVTPDGYLEFVWEAYGSTDPADVGIMTRRLDWSGRAEVYDSTTPPVVDPTDCSDFDDFGQTDGDDFIYATPGDDKICAMDGNDEVHALAGDDLVHGRGGDDKLIGDGGNDEIYGDEGNDTIYGGSGVDTVYGGTGDDFIKGDDGDDLLNGDEGNDTILGGQGNDTILGGAGENILKGGDGADNIEGGDDRDQIWGGNGHDAIDAGAGNDSIAGDAGEDFIAAGDGNDTVYAGADDDIVSGGAGEDFIKGDGGDDTLNGDEGNDTVLGGEGNDAIEGGTGEDILKGDAGDDNINGGDDRDQIWGGTGHDVLDGGAGNDNLAGDAGDDVMTGGLGNDTMYGGDDNDHMTGGEGNDHLEGQNGDDHVFGGAGDDMVRGDNGNDVVDGGDGNDQLHGGQGDDQLYGGAGDDLIYGGGDHDVITGGDGNDVLVGESGIDSLYGGAGNDVVKGGDGADVMFGDAGNDEMRGGRDDDAMTGGEGADRYYHHAGEGLDSIDNFDAAETGDAMLFADMTDFKQLWFRQDANDLVVERMGTDDGVRITDWYAGSEYQHMDFQAGGQTLETADVQGLVDAMAAFQTANGAFDPQTSTLDGADPAQAALLADIDAQWKL